MCLTMTIKIPERHQSKMELFVEIVNCSQPLTIFSEIAILDGRSGGVFIVNFEHIWHLFSSVSFLALTRVRSLVVNGFRSATKGSQFKFDS